MAGNYQLFSPALRRVWAAIETLQASMANSGDVDMLEAVQAKQEQLEQREAQVTSQLAQVQTMTSAAAEAAEASTEDRTALWAAMREAEQAIQALRQAATSGAVDTASTGSRATQALAAATESSELAARALTGSEDAIRLGTETRASVAAMRATLTALTGKVAAVETALTTAGARQLMVRRATPQLPLIALGAVYDQPVTWASPMPSADYQVELTPAPGLLGKATTKVKPGTQTAAGLTVQVTASLLVAAGNTLDITAYRYA